QPLEPIGDTVHGRALLSLFRTAEPPGAGQQLAGLGGGQAAGEGAGAALGAGAGVALLQEKGFVPVGPVVPGRKARRGDVGPQAALQDGSLAAGPPGPDRKSVV